MPPHLLQGLLLLGADPNAFPEIEDDLTRFSAAAFKSRLAFFVDWRVSNFAAIESLVNRFSRETPLDLIRIGDDGELLVERDDVEERTLIKDIDALERDTVVATFLARLPRRIVGLRLVRFDPSDADHYLILEEADAEALRNALGSDCAKILKTL